MSGCDILVFGPMTAGEPMQSGNRYRVSGYGWSCATHGTSDHGYQTEMGAEQGADAHERAWRAER